MKDLYTENFKPMKKEIKEDTERLKDVLCLLVGKINIVKHGILLNQLNPSKNPHARLCRILSKSLKIIMKTQKTPNSNAGGINKQDLIILQNHNIHSKANTWME